MSRALYARQLAALVTAVGMALLTAGPVKWATASSPPLLSTADIGTVKAVGITNGALPGYVATSSGLYRSASSSYALWTKQSAITGVVALSSNPRNADDIVYTRQATPLGAGDGICRSTDAGRTAQRVAPCPLDYLSRSSSMPTILVGTASECATHLAYPALEDRIMRSTDDGITWTSVFTRADGGDYPGFFGSVAVAPNDPQHVLASVVYSRLSGDLWGTNNSGQTWTRRLMLPVDYYFPESIAIDPRQPRLAWSVWGAAGLYRSHDGGQTWQHVAVAGFATRIAQGNSVNQSARVLAGAEFTSVRVDPLSGRLCLGVVFDKPNAPPLPTAIYALDA